MCTNHFLGPLASYQAKKQSKRCTKRPSANILRCAQLRALARTMRTYLSYHHTLLGYSYRVLIYVAGRLPPLWKRDMKDQGSMTETTGPCGQLARSESSRCRGSPGDQKGRRYQYRVRSAMSRLRNCPGFTIGTIDKQQVRRVAP
jgi:hypothetical protein